MVEQFQIVAGLGRAGMAAEVPAAVIERGYSDSQRSTFTTLGQLATDARRLDIDSPAVVVIGEVVSAAPRLAGSADLLMALSTMSVKSDV